MLGTIDLKIVEAIFGGDCANGSRVGLVGLFVVHEKVVLRGEVSQQELRDVVLLHNGSLTFPSRSLHQCRS
jgi:hypothetical protein